MKGYFDTIPVDIDESARIDGAGTTRIFFELIMRLSLPDPGRGRSSSASSPPSTSCRSPRSSCPTPNTTLAVGLNGLVANPLIQEWGMMAAGGVMAAIPLVIVFLVTQRSLVTGLTAGAVKG